MVFLRVIIVCIFAFLCRGEYELMEGSIVAHLRGPCHITGKLRGTSTFISPDEMKALLECIVSICFSSLFALRTHTIAHSDLVCYIFRLTWKPMLPLRPR